MKRRLLFGYLFIGVIGLCHSVAFQANVITGKVTETGTGDALPGVTIQIKGTGQGTIADLDGNYSISVDDPDAVLIFSYVGFKQQEIAIRGRSVINVTLESDLGVLEEVVVIGYGTRDRADLTGAVSTVKAENIESLQINSIEQSMSGQISGVQLRANGAPGSGPQVLIRGVASTGNNNAPLYVVDGVPLGNLDSQRDNFVLSSIDPSSIESVTVLKDASAKAIYGSRAANGVIIIKTKRGKVGEPSITFGMSYGSQSVPDFERPDVMNAEELRQYLIQHFDDREAAGLLSTGESTERDRLIELGDQGVGTNWFDEITRTAPWLRYNIGVNGGSEDVRYNVSASYDNQQGTLINTGFERFSVRANMDVKLTERIRFGLDLAPTRTLATGGNTDGGSRNFQIFRAVPLTRWMDPTAPVRQADGSLTTVTQGDLIPFFNANPVYQLTARLDRRRTNQILASTYLEVDIIEGLKIRTFGSVQNIDRRNTLFVPSDLPGESTAPNLDGTRQARSNLDEFNSFNLVWENTLNYSKTIADNHRIDVLAGFTMEKRRIDNTKLRANNLIDESVLVPNSGNVDPSNINNFTGNGQTGENTLNSVIGRVDYAYQAKYYLTATIRRDGSSRFGRDVRYGNFPSIAAAWRVSDESFFEVLPNFISDLKLEAGYGLSGSNANLENFTEQGQIKAIGDGALNRNYVFGGDPAPGAHVSVLPNPLLTWEESKEINYGIDIGFLEDRFYLSTDYYDIETSGFLADLPLPRSSGLDNVKTNLGSIENRGIEIELGFRDILPKGKLRWNANINYTRNRSKVLELAAASGFVRPGVVARAFTETRVGQQVGLYRGFQVTGLFTQEEIEDPEVPKYPGAIEGSMKYVDGNGDGVLGDQEDFVIIGNPNPDFIFGIVNNFKYEDFDLSIVMNGAIGQQIWNAWHQFNGNQDGVFNVDRRQLERWRPGQDPSTATVPGTASVKSRELYRLPNSIGQLEDASYLWVRNITLGYTFKVDNVLKTARVYFSAQNPFLFTEYESGNPEVNRSGDTGLVRNVNYGAFPISRILTIGLNASF